jgi:hypothetical protein
LPIALEAGEATEETAYRVVTIESAHRAAETVMPPSLTWESLHDWTLVAIELRWERGEVVVQLRGGPASTGDARIDGTSVRLLEYPRRQKWSPSGSIYEVRGPRRTRDGEADRLEIEVQSGDTIVIEAEEFRLAGTPSTNARGGERP